MKYLIPVLLALVCFAAPAQACDQVFAVQAYAVQPVYQPVYAVVHPPVYAVQQVAVPVYVPIERQVVEVQRIKRIREVERVERFVERVERFREPQVIRQRSFSFSRTVIR